jgi:hypothetical protein
MTAANSEFAALPTGRDVAPVPVPHFPDALHTVVWRNWDVIDAQRLADVLGANLDQITALAASMGLPPQRRIVPSELRRNYMTIIRRNWHLLPYEQLCRLLGWDAHAMRFALNEDDFMWVKLGGYKPNCPPVRYQTPDAAAQARVQQIAQIVRDRLGDALRAPAEPPFGFIDRFNRAAASKTPPSPAPSSMRMVYPYFLRYGDPLLGEGINDIPEGYLAELSACGVNAIWLQGVLNTLYPWDLAPELSHGWQERIANLNRLVTRCAAFGIDVLIYLNEPRAMPGSFFEKHPDLRGMEVTPRRSTHLPDLTALCTSTQPVQDFLTRAVRHLFEQVPALGGLLTIAYSENLTNCFSRNTDSPCPRCQARGPEIINAEVCSLLERGMRQAGSNGKFLYYVWSTPQAWLPGILDRLPDSAWVLSVSEWGTPFTRGDYTGTVNEYAISAVGPGGPSLRQWELARQRHLKTAAKLQVANTWELSCVPYIPAMRLVARHLSNIAQAGVDGLMLGWTLGGSPSPNLELAAEFSRSPRPSVEQAMLNVARRRFGDEDAQAVVAAWNLLSDAFEQFPFDISVCYKGPQSLGPANLLFSRPSGFDATMVTFPFDDLDHWRGPYSRQTFQTQFEKLADAWQSGVDALEQLRQAHPSAAIDDEWRIAETARLHFCSTANQIRFIQLRQSDPAAAAAILHDEIALARRLFDLVGQDSRLGFEATNQYGYLRLDLVEKILNCEDLLLQL